MSNEIQINVVLNDQTAAQKTKIKADLQAWADGLPPVKVTATNPIDEAWQAEVDAGIKAAAGEPVDVVFTADMAAVEAAAEETFAAIRAAAGEPLAIGPANMEEFQASALEAIAATRAEIELAFDSVRLPPVYATATILGQEQAGSGDGMLALPAGSYGQMAALPPGAPSSFQPSYEPGPLFGGGQDPYAAARQRIADETPIEIPVRARNPIDDAWLAQVKASVRSVASDTVQIPVHPDLEEFQAQLESTLAELMATTHADIPVDVGDGMIFREQVQELVQQVESSVHAVIGVQIDNEGALSELQQKTVAASQASLDLVNAEQKLNQAMAGGNEEEVGKARLGVAAASTAETQASREMEAAMAAAAEGEVAAAGAADTASFSMRGLMQAMGPLWMVMNVAQLAMFAFGNTSSTAAQQASDASQQVIGLGQSAGNAAAGLLAGNTELQKIAPGLSALGSSSSQFASVYTGNLSDAAAYTQRFVDEQKNLGSTQIHWDDTSIQAMEKAIGQTNTTMVTADHTVAQLTGTVNGNKDAYNALSPAMKAQVDELNHLNDVVPQATDALKNMQDAAGQTGQALEGLFSAPGSFDTEAAGAHAFGLSLNDVEQAYDNIKLLNPKDTLDQVTAAFDQNMNAANQAASAITTSMQQEQQAVVSAQRAVDNARHSAEQSGLAVANAQHAEAQAQQQYTTAVDAEVTAQQAVTTARAQAAQELINLTLQQKDAATAATSANLSLFDAQQAAAKLGVNSGNAQGFADLANNGGVTTGNEAQVKAALALIQAQNQVADSQNTSTQAQQALNTAQQQGIDNNPGVLAANKALVQAQNQVEQAAYAEKQAHDQVSQAQYAEQQASDALRVAKQQLTTAENNLRDATDLSTVSGQQHMSMVLQLAGALRATGLPVQTQYNDLIKDTATMFGGSTQAAENYLKQIGLIKPDYKFGVTAVAGVDWSQVEPLVKQLHMNPATLLNANGGYISGAGGPKDDAIPSMLSDGEFVVNAAATSQNRGTLEAINAGRYADGGLVSANLIGAEVGAGYQDMVDTATVMGLAAPPSLPQYVAPPPVHISGGGGNLSGNRGANEQIMQQVFATMFGWSGQQWADAVTLEMMEAGFNNTAQNPTSTAFGMGQFLDSTWASYGIPKTADPTLQSEAMGRYIQARYGSPAGALAHEHAFHWYGAGGPANGWVGINDGGPEAIQLPNGSTVMPAANTAGLTQSPAPATEVTMTFGGDVSNAFAVLIMNLIRGDKIQLNVGGQRVRAG